MNRKTVWQRVIIALVITLRAAKSQAQVNGYLSAYLNDEYTIASFSTSTTLIGETPLALLDPSFKFVAIAFPQVLNSGPGTSR